MGKDKATDELVKLGTDLLKQLRLASVAAKKVTCQGKKGQAVYDTVKTCSAAVDALGQCLTNICEAIIKLENAAKKQGKDNAPYVVELVKLANRRLHAYSMTYGNKSAVLRKYEKQLRKVKH